MTMRRSARLRLAEQHQDERKEASGREHWCGTTGQEEDR